MWKSYDGMEFEKVCEQEARKDIGAAFGSERGISVFEHLKAGRFDKVRTVYEEVKGRNRTMFLFVWLYSCLPEGAVVRGGGRS